uniref:MBL fold metallo-hydrolase n=1 Tax=Nocardia farcinica TaxID=37329 RepID=UPI0024582C62
HSPGSTCYLVRGADDLTYLFTGDGDPGRTALAFAIGATMMILAGLVELVLGVRAEQRSLESIAAPLSFQSDEPDTAGVRR